MLSQKTVPFASLPNGHDPLNPGKRVARGPGLDYDQTWVWNMGLIARQGGAESLELYKKVLRASAAPPMAIPDGPDIGHNALAFDDRQMQVCFDTGYALAQQLDPWLTQPRVVDDIPAWAFELLGL